MYLLDEVLRLFDELIIPYRVQVPVKTLAVLHTLVLAELIPAPQLDALTQAVSYSHHVQLRVVFASLVVD